MSSNPFNDFFMVPDIDRGSVQVSFTAPEGFNGLDWQIKDADGKCAVSGRADGKPGEKVSFEAIIPNCKLWNINTPYLYSFAGNGKEIKFGMRTIGVSGRDILINGEKVVLKGYIRGREAHDHPNLQNLSLTEYYEKNLQAAKDYGFNLVRFHSRIPDEECFEVADRLGMLIHIEIRKYYGRYQKERATMDSDAGEMIDENAWREAILTLRNHPSLMVYCMGNEIRHPGTNPFVEHIAEVTKELDPTRLFIDTCAHGEFDRTYVDFDVQHMSYYYPFGKDYDMFENTYNWLIYGSCKDQQLTDADREDDPNYKVTRAVNPVRPVLAHEICHYIAYRDLDALEAKFDQYAPDQKPWWIGELNKLIDLKGCREEYPQLRAASRYFQFQSWKLGIEAARRSQLLCGFHLLQLCDTERYENSNGLIDCFDDKTGVSETEFLKFNADTILLADLPQRTFFERENVKVPVLLSHFDAGIKGMADFSFKLIDATTGEVLRNGKLTGISLDEKGRREIVSLTLKMPESAAARSLKLEVELALPDGRKIANDWNLWAFPNRPAELKAPKATAALDDICIQARYPQFVSTGTPEAPEQLMIVNRFSDEVFKHLENGGDVLMLYRVPENRDRKYAAEPEKYYLPSVWDRLKGCIWDRGNNLGAYINPHPVFDAFPHNGFMDFQFHGLIDDADKLNLDTFPVPVTPLMRGVDRPVRDRFDVYTYGLSEFQPEWTMRRFGYAIELKVGKGRLFLTGFNFTGLAKGTPEVCFMFETLIDYVTSGKFQPQETVSVEELRNYLANAPRQKERKMTQYWQLNEEPLESARYWKESEEYIAGTLKVPPRP